MYHKCMKLTYGYELKYHNVKITYIKFTLRVAQYRVVEVLLQILLHI